MRGFEGVGKQNVGQLYHLNSSIIFFGYPKTKFNKNSKYNIFTSKIDLPSRFSQVAAILCMD